ncbi:hypothetical protein [Klebsiella pneumoniae]|uniref:hypothetical protein n=1 Tax=Klebsiella pneumoniae TaxID=573 RepID=UPI0021180BB2|nr:hypothetical protein [Klebsiella pneumoniae]MCQ8281856.1 hypothetical protein [Klebsiella pneumoniae]
MAEIPLPTPTQAPVPSTDIRNAVFAGAKLDEEVTSIGEFYIDRLGVKRLTNTGRNNQFNSAQQYRANQFNSSLQDMENQVEQAISLAGWQELGDWSAGITVNSRNQIIWHSNSWYKYIGELPHTTSGSGPAEDGGIYSEETESGLWVNVGAASTIAAMGFVTAGMLGIFPSATLIQTEKLTQLFAGDGLLAITEPGVYLTDDTLYLRDGTSLYLAPGVTLKQADGTNKNVISNTLADAPETPCDGALSYALTQLTEGYHCLITVPLTNHGFSVGDAISIRGATNFGWNGTYIVFQVVDANSFIVQGYVVPDDVNSAGTIKVAKANKNITIYGEGTVDYNYSGNNTAGATKRFCINLKHVFRPTVKGINILNAFKYACCISDAAHVTEHDIYVDTNSDGLHHQGPIWGADIRNISGNAGDDLVAFTGGDFAAYTQSIGDFNGIVIDGLYPTACYYAVKMTGNDDHRYRYVSVKNVGGVSKHGAIYAQNDTNTDRCRIDMLSIENVSNASAQGDGWPCIFFRALRVGRVVAKNIQPANKNQIVVSIDSFTIIDEADFDVTCRNYQTSKIIQAAHYSYVGKLTLRGYHMLATENAQAVMLTGNAVINEVIYDGKCVSDPANTNKVTDIIQVNSNSYVNRLRFTAESASDYMRSLYRETSAASVYKIDAVFLGSISGTTLTVTSVKRGAISAGATLLTGAVSGTTIVSAIAVNSDGTGTYTVSASQTVAAGTVFSSSALVQARPFIEWSGYSHKNNVQGFSLYRTFGVKAVCNCVIDGATIQPVNVNTGVTGVVEVTGSPTYVGDTSPGTFVKRVPGGAASIYVNGDNIRQSIGDVNARANDRFFNTGVNNWPGVGYAYHDGQSWHPTVERTQSGISVSAVFNPSLGTKGIFSSLNTPTAAVPAPNVYVPPRTGSIIKYILRQDATGGRTLTWDAYYVFPNGYSDANNVANAFRMIEFMFTGSKFLCVSDSGWGA